ncbi:hypothetical protein FOZ60_005042 [Perkinsus olseni]|uniref:C3H1-type domain-containing protein n=1 Tax=Perkinsus olseni TaxID=32597 RepID=A0A7J6NRS3_PEROL|nr:hypothetical protein FOZ60_005042 [Perkinsus olseni]
MAHGGEPGPLLEFLGLESVDALQYLTTSDLDDQFRAKSAPPATRATMSQLFQTHCKTSFGKDEATSSTSRSSTTPLSHGHPTSLLITDDWSVSGSDADHRTSSTKFLDVVRCITLPNNAPYRGRTDDRSITAFLNCLYQEVLQADLNERQAWLLLLRAFDEPAKTNLRQAVQRSCVARGLWMKDFAAMVREGAAWAELEFRESNSHDNFDDKFDDFKQRFGESVHALADRLSLLKSEADSVGYTVTDSQLLRVYRRSLYPRLRSLASTTYCSCDTVDDLAHRLHRHLRQNPDFEKNSKQARSATRTLPTGPSADLSSSPAPPPAVTSDPSSKPSSRGPPLDPTLREFCLANNVCMYYVANGICRRGDCPYKHEKPTTTAASTPAPALPTTGPSAKACVSGPAGLAATSGTSSHTLRCPDFGSLHLEVDTGCTHSLITHQAALHLQHANPSAHLRLVDPVSFTTASHRDGLHAHCILTIALTLLDESHNPYTVSWSPYVTYSPLGGSSDGLLGRDIIFFNADRTLVVPTTSGPTLAAAFLCDPTDLPCPHPSRSSLADAPRLSAKPTSPSTC